MEPMRISALAALTVVMAAPVFAQPAPRSASPQYRLHQERIHHAARYHSAYRYEYQPAYRYEYQPAYRYEYPFAYRYETSNTAGVIADTTGVNPFGAPPYPWAYYDGPYVSFGGPFPY
jgi:hypothetical protein